MALSKAKLAVVTSAVGGFVAGGILMASMPVFAASSGSTTNSTTPTSESTSTKAHAPGRAVQLRATLHKNVAEVATDLHVTQKQLLQDFKAGKSLDDIAAASKVSQAQLQSDLQTLVKNDLDKAVSEGHLNATREAKLLKRIDAKLPKFMADKHVLQHARKFSVDMHLLKYVANKLHMKPAQLVSKLKAGQSINQIAIAQGVSPSTLQKDIVQELDSKLNSRVTKLLGKTDWFQKSNASTNTNNVSITNK